MIFDSQELQEDLVNQEAAVKELKALGEDLSLQDRKENEQQIKSQLDVISTRWTTVFNQLSEIKRRQVLMFLLSPIMKLRCLKLLHLDCLLSVTWHSDQ